MNRSSKIFQLKHTFNKHNIGLASLVNFSLACLSEWRATANVRWVCNGRNIRKRPLSLVRWSKSLQQVCENRVWLAGRVINHWRIITYAARTKVPLPKRLIACSWYNQSNTTRIFRFRVWWCCQVFPIQRFWIPLVWSGSAVKFNQSLFNYYRRAKRCGLNERRSGVYEASVSWMTRSVRPIVVSNFL